MSWYDNHEPGDALFVLLILFVAISIIAAIGIYLIV